MGYTHYWELENGIEQADWNKFLEGARQIIETAVSAGIKLQDDSAGAAIFINGVGANAHEAFVVTSEDAGFNFCKTAQKPYDTVVTAILIHLKQSLGSKVVVTSDGSWNDWSDGRLLYETVYDKNIDVDFLGV
jgi:hypothetical protein